jgi:hypothetical protein
MNAPLTSDFDHPLTLGVDNTVPDRAVLVSIQGHSHLVLKALKKELDAFTQSVWALESNKDWPLMC